MSDPIGNAARHDAAPRGTDPSHQIPGRETLAQGVRHDAPGVDGEADDGKGQAGEQPPLGRCHDQIGEPRDERARDECPDVSHPAREAVCEQGSRHVAHSSRGQEHPVQLFGHAPVDRRDDDEHAHDEPLQRGQRREQRHEKPQRPILQEVPGAVQDRAVNPAASSGARYESPAATGPQPRPPTRRRRRAES